MRDEGDVELFHKDSTKTRLAGFSFLLPLYCTSFVNKYLEEWENDEKENRLIKNFARSHGRRRVNTGWRTMDKMLRRCEVILGLKSHTLFTHSFRRSGATTLANGGASIIQLKRTGRWSSTALVEGYIENCNPEKENDLQ